MKYDTTHQRCILRSWMSINASVMTPFMVDFCHTKAIYDYYKSFVKSPPPPSVHWFFVKNFFTTILDLISFLSLTFLCRECSKNKILQQITFEVWHFYWFMKHWFSYIIIGALVFITMVTLQFNSTQVFLISLSMGPCRHC